MYYLFLAIIIVLGCLSPVQTSANSRATDFIKSPIVSSLCSFFVGTAALFLLTFLIDPSSHAQAGSLSSLPWWAWLGGAAGAVGITANILLFPILGSMQTVLMPMVGQIIAGLLIDSFGLFGSPKFPLTFLRFLGFALVMVGVFCVVSHKGRHFRRKDTLVWQLFGNLAGAILALQPAINSTLATGLGSSLQASFISFATGTVLLLLFCLSRREHRPCIPLMFSVRRPLWTWTGGLLGVCFVVGQTYLADKVGVGLLTILNIFGMLLGSTLIDSFGLLGAKKIEITPKKFLGLFLVIAGIVLLNI